MNQLLARKSLPVGRTQARYRARLVVGDVGLARALDLRARVFRAGSSDEDSFDQICLHMVVERVQDGGVVATFRVLQLTSGAEISRSYSAQYYDLEGLAAYSAPMLELGRFCVAPSVSDPEVLRVAWAALAQIVDAGGVQMLFGCSSFEGTDARVYADTFALLRAKYLAPRTWRPGTKAPEVVEFGAHLPDRVQALRVMPPLLRSYLTMGGWVSDHAVVDRELGTLHVFTGLEIAAIPASRARAIRAAAG